MHRLTAVVAALLLVALLAPPVAAEPVPGFGFAGVVEVPPTQDVLALDDGGFVVVAYEGLTKIDARGRVEWTKTFEEWSIIAVSDGRRIYVLQSDSVLALDASGDPDPSFGGDGEVALDPIGYLAVGRDGRLLVYSLNVRAVTRLRQDGSVEQRFEVVNAVVAVADDGSLFTADGGSLVTIRRYTSDGRLDGSWGDGGQVVVDGYGLYMDAAPDGSLVAARVQWSSSGLTTDVHLFRWTADGTPDPAFGLGGVVSARTRCGREVLQELRVADDGTIYVVGASGDPFERAPAFVSAFTADGRLRGYENLGSGSPYWIIGRDAHVSLNLAVPASGDRIGVVASGGDGRDRLHALSVAESFDGPDPDTGYWLVSRDGAWPRGQASLCVGVDVNRDIVGAASGAQHFGYWMVTAAGRVETAGKVAHYGDISTPLNASVLGITARPQGDGYWLIASDGGVFSFGGASFFGSTGAMRLNQPIVGMASTPSGRGYWLVASDGGVFSFGDASFFGSTGAILLNQPITGMAPTSTGRGYWMVARDGGVFSFGDAPYHGSVQDGVGPVGEYVGIMTP